MNSQIKKSKDKNDKTINLKLNLNHLNIIRSKSKTLGEVEFKRISFGDRKFFADFLERIKDDRELVTRLLYHKLAIPKVAFAEFNKISDDELKKLARDFLAQEQRIFKYLEETTEAEFFSNFRKAIKKYYQKQDEQLQATALGTAIESSKKIFENFNRQYRRFIIQSITPYIPASIKEISKVAQQVRESQLRIVESLRPVIVESLRPVIEQYQLNAHILEALRPRIEIWQRWVEQNRILFDSYRKYWQTFQEQYKIAEEEAIQILRKYKWFITPSLPYYFVFDAVKVGRRRGNQRGAMNRLFVDYFSSNNFANLGILVEGWKRNIIFKPRMKIFRDCISAMKDRRSSSNPSNFILPTLIAQIDGIQAEFMKQKGLSFDLKKGKWKDEKGDVVNWKAWFRGQTSDQKLLDLANDILLNILFQGSQRGKPLETPFTFNRHKIMHGEYLKYGRIDNTVRAFLILDFLATLK